MGKQIYHVLEDPDYQDSYIDIDETRTRKNAKGEETAYRYIHGGFRKKAVKFSIHFPDPEQYRGVFFQYLSPFPGPDEEMAAFAATGADDVILFSILHGAYFVESNMGVKDMFAPDPDETVRWKSSAAVAEFSRKKAMEIYSCSRPAGIVYGGSGGGYKTMACIENTDAWDGAVPYVIGTPASLPNTITMHVQGERVLRNAFPKILDHLDAGGSGDMYEGLDRDEADMLRELTSMGIPPLAWYPEAKGQFSDLSLPVLMPGIKRMDPGYFSDFWTVPGYMGADPKSSASKDRLQFEGTVKSVRLPEQEENGNGEPDSRSGVDDAWKKMIAEGKDSWIELERLPEGKNLYMRGVSVTFESGSAAGKQLMMDQVYPGENGGGYITVSMGGSGETLRDILSGVKPGDRLTLDNSDYIAIQSYYRHQVPADLSFHAWDQFRKEDGTPALPQRQNVMGYSFTGTGTVQDGNIQCRVIMIQALMDESTCPWSADWYRGKVIESRGNEDDYRLYYMQRCMHGDVTWLENNMSVNYKGALFQALLDMAAWVMEGKEPLRTTVYRRSGGQIEEEPDAARRRGMQAGVRLTVNGEKCAHVRAGEEFTLKAEMTMPENAGEITSARFDLNDNWTYSVPAQGLFPIEGEVKRTEKDGVHGAVSEINCKYEEPGVHFASVRITGQRDGDADDIFTQVCNLDRVRIIVE